MDQSFEFAIKPWLAIIVIRHVCIYIFIRFISLLKVKELLFEEIPNIYIYIYSHCYIRTYLSTLVNTFQHDHSVAHEQCFQAIHHM